MAQQDPEKLLAHYLDGNLGEDDRVKLLLWYQSLPEPEATKFFEKFSDAIDALNKEELDSLEQKLRLAASYKRAETKKGILERVVVPPFYLRIAASVVLLLACAWGYYTFNTHEAVQVNQVVFLEKHTNYGEVAEIILPDSSVVMLNAGSSLKYPQSFQKSQTREVYMAGEAFFKIVPDKSHPFIVHTPQGVNTQVLGTSFNINTYKSPEEVAVAVITGKVAIGTATKALGKLTANQQLTYNTVTTAINHTQNQYADDWTRGEIIFNGDELQAVVAELERAYNIHIQIASNVTAKLRCSGKFYLKQKPEEIIKVLSILHDLKYTSTNKKIILSK